MTRAWMIVAAAALSFAAGWMANGWRRDSIERAQITAAVERTTAAYAERDADFVRLLERDQQVSAENARLRQELERQAEALRDAVRGLQLVTTTTTVIHDENGQHDCPDTRRSTAYRLCINAALSGDASAIAACEASRGHAALRDQ